MMITDDAREFLKELFREQNTKNIRIFFAGYG
jgi:tRNA G46 methylase TrmB